MAVVNKCDVCLTEVVQLVLVENIIWMAMHSFTTYGAETWRLKYLSMIPFELGGRSGSNDWWKCERDESPALCPLCMDYRTRVLLLLIADVLRKD